MKWVLILLVVGAVQRLGEFETQRECEGAAERIVAQRSQPLDGTYGVLRQWLESERRADRRQLVCVEER